MKRAIKPIIGLILGAVLVFQFSGWEGLSNYWRSITDAFLIIFPLIKEEIQDIVLSPKVLINIGCFILSGFGIYIGTKEKKEL